MIALVLKYIFIQWKPKQLLISFVSTRVAVTKELLKAHQSTLRRGNEELSAKWRVADYRRRLLPSDWRASDHSQMLKIFDLWT